MRWKWPLALVIALVAGGGFAWWRTQGPVPVTVTTPTRGPAVDAIYATGTVEPTVQLPIAPRVAGRLVELNVDEGDRVRRGRVLARLDAADLEQSVVELAARAQFARDQLRRTEALVGRGVTAAIELDRARAEALAAEAVRPRARAQRDFTALTAPADGTIIRRDGEIGQFIPVGQAVFFMSCCAPLRVTAEVDEEDIPRVYVGQRAVLRADALPGRTFDGEVAEVTPKGDPVARSYRVRIRLADPGELRVGMTTDANLIVEERREALLVPTNAVRDGAVWVVRDGRLARQPVTLGIGGDLRTEVRAGLDAAERVVAPLPEDPEEGRRVRIRPAAEASSGGTAAAAAEARAAGANGGAGAGGSAGGG
ncbi:MAG: efflux RND transporter periplasmic adaptor subunit [Pseudomonadota bacterium]